MHSETGLSDDPLALDQATTQEEVRHAFSQVVNEGVRRLERSWPALLATGIVGGIDVSIGVFGLLVVQHLTGSKVLGSLAFTIASRSLGVEAIDRARVRGEEFVA